MKMKLLENKGRNNKRLTLPLTFATVVLLFFASTIAMGTTQMNKTVKKLANGQDPIEVTEDFTLTGDLFFSTHGLIIKADGITIDGAGHKIHGSKSVSTCEWITETDPNVDTTGHGILNQGYDNIVIKNLEIENFATGIWLHGIGPNTVIDNRIENCVIHDNGLNDMSGSGSESVTHGMHLAFARNIEIINNEIYNNEGTGGGCGDGGNGIFVYGGGSTDQDLNTITGNKLNHNAKSGFWTKMKMDHTTISDNEIYENGNGEGVTDSTRGGVMLRCKMSNQNTIQGNNVYNNNGDGLFIGGNNNDIRNNDIIANSHHGVNFARNDGSKNNYLYENVICSNHEYDVYNVHTETDNTGDENTGTTAYNYRDEGTSGNTYFTYPCNNPPNKPSKPDGPTSGKVGTSYNYSTSTTDPDGDQVKYGWDWNGDKVVDEWTSFYESGETITTSHTWTEKGTYNVRVKARDKDGVESEWSDPLSVTMPKNKVLQHNLLFLRLLERLLQRLPALLDWGLIY